MARIGWHRGACVGQVSSSASELLNGLGSAVCAAVEYQPLAASKAGFARVGSASGRGLAAPAAVAASRRPPPPTFPARRAARAHGRDESS
eukprot:2469326-Pyramimonas_sp.AAC.1